MASKFLEDIVEDELRNKAAISERVGNFLANTNTRFIVENPAFTAIAMFAGSEYTVYENFVRENLPEIINSSGRILGAYVVYNVLGFVKEYILEKRILMKNFSYRWFSENPKITALIGAVAGAFAANRGLTSVFSELYGKELSPAADIHIMNYTVNSAVAGGIVTEAIVRGIKNIRRIKRSIKKIKTNISEKVYNFIFENPMILSAAATAVTFSFMYQNSYSMIGDLQKPGSKKIITGNLIEDLVNQPGEIVNLAVQSSLVGAVSLGAVLTAGSFFHSHSLREFWLKGNKIYYSLFGNKRKVIEFQSKLTALPNSIERIIANTVELGNVYYHAGDRNSAFKYYRKAIKLFNKKSDQISYSDLFLDKTTLKRIARFYRKLKLNDNTEESLINKIFIGLLNGDESILEDIKETIENNDKNPRLKYIYGKALEILGYKESGRIQKEKAVIEMIESGADIIDANKSKNTISVFDDESFREEIIIKGGTKNSVSSEREATETLKRILSNFDDYDVPLPIATIKIREKYYYVMEQESGDLFEKRIRSGQAAYHEFLMIADFMGLMHTKLNASAQKERDYREIIKDRLLNLGISEETTNSIYDGLPAVIDSLEGIVRVCNRDAHPRNWIIDEFGGIIAIDMEADRIVPLTFDTANLLNQHRMLDEKEREGILKKHFSSFKHYSGKKIKIDNNRYRLAYLNSVILRSLEIYSQVVVSERQIMFDSMQNAQIAIRRIESDFPEYYKEKITAYTSLNIALAEMRARNQ